MLNRRASLYAILIIALTACTKQNVLPTESVTAGTTSNADAVWWPFPNRNGGTGDDSVPTTFGLSQEPNYSMTTQDNINDNVGRMQEANVNITRVQMSLSKSKAANKTLDYYLSNGYFVQVIINWEDKKNGYRDFPRPEELQEFKEEVSAFFDYYAPYKNQIIYVAFENEWDWQIINNNAVLSDYLAELSTVTEIGHGYGFKISDGGITPTVLKRWTYSQLSGDEAQQWLDTYWVGLDTGYNYFNYYTLMDIMNTYTSYVQNVDFDYSNVHWYNETDCGNGFEVATEKFRLACNKSVTACNEFSISAKTPSLDLFSATVNEIKVGNPKFAIAYSGTGDTRAAKLTNDMLDELR